MLLLSFRHNYLTWVILALVQACGGSGGNDPINSQVQEPQSPPTEGLEETPSQPESNGSVKQMPAGIYHSAGTIRPDQTNSLVSESVNSQDYVDGTLVRVSWKDIHSAENDFNFDLIRRELDRAKVYGASISLAILDSKEMPEFVLLQCESFEYQFRAEPATTCLPWDDTYQSAKQSLLNALGEAFDNDESLTAIYFSYAAMSNGIEMHWRVDESEFANSGYTYTRLVDSYNDVMDMYINAFPTTPIIMEVHNVFNSPDLAREGFTHCFNGAGSRCGVAIWWCSSRMALNPSEAEYDVYPIAQQAIDQSFAVCQTIGNFTNQADRFDQGQNWTSEEAFRHEMDYFTNAGFKRFEIWSADLQNRMLTDILESEYIEELRN